MQMNHLPRGAPTPSSTLGKIVAFVATVVLAGLALMFSAVLLAALLIVGTLAAAYLWWKTRDLRRQMREFPPGDMDADGERFEQEMNKGRVIEGEVIYVDDPRDSKKN